MITRAENTILPSEQHYKNILSSARLPYSVQKPVRTGFVLNNRNTIDIDCLFKRLQPLLDFSRRREPSISINSILQTNLHGQ